MTISAPPRPRPSTARVRPSAAPTRVPTRATTPAPAPAPPRRGAQASATGACERAGDPSWPCSPAALGRTKRLLDVVLALLALVVTVPVLVVVALLVRRSSPGPVLFRQERVGRDGRPFTLVKFRTMVVDGRPLRSALVNDRVDGGPLFKMRDDPRVTRVGRVLRRYSLDELPQLWNVLRGEMSLVGPRPALPCEVVTYDARARRRLEVKPGLTGPWQVGGRSDLSWSDGLALDLDYVRRASLAYDLRVLLATVRVVLRPVGAY